MISNDIYVLLKTKIQYNITLHDPYVNDRKQLVHTYTMSQYFDLHVSEQIIPIINLE